MNKEEFEKRFPGKNYEDYSPHPNGGGLVAKTAYVSASAYVGEKAAVHGYSEISRRACLLGNATVHGNGVVSGHAVVCGNAVVNSHAVVSGYAVVSDYALVCGHARIWDHARVCDDATVTDHAQVSNYVVLCGYTVVSGYSWLRVGVFNTTPHSVNLSYNTLTVQGDGSITIGCEHHDLDHWLKYGCDIGKKHGYTVDAIVEAYDILMKIEEGEIK